MNSQPPPITCDNAEIVHKKGRVLNPKTKLSSTLVLALGNDIMGDDAAALVASGMLKEQFAEDADFNDTMEAGLALMDIMAGYERVLLLDTIITGRHEPGTVLEFSQDDFRKVVGPSPHYMGLPEVIQLADRMSVSFPPVICIIALEIERPVDFAETLSPGIKEAVPRFVQKAAETLRRWKKEGY
ncbi:MAG: hydrogenase maturation protease [Planctomycetes bacterium]|nr:hydrogenase maturation protease [Planctomycetota bacterium]